MKFSAIRGLTSRRLAGGVTGGMGATAMVYSDDTPALIKLLAIASQAIYGARVQVCNGVDDEVEINAAMGAIAAIGGKVLLSEGTFHIADPIVIPGNNIMLRGLGSGTIIDGDLLATGEHAVVISGVTDCVVRDLAVFTEDGGGKVCHCIFVEDGANGTRIEQVHIIDSDSDGIHVEGTTMFDVHIHDCHIEDTDGTGIYVGVDGGETHFRFHIADNLIMSSGTNGIELADGGLGYYYFIVDGNIIYLATLDGFTAFDLFNAEITNNSILSCVGDGIYYNSGLHTQIRSNVVSDNDGEGIWLIYADDASVSDNICWSNGGTADHAGIKINPECIQILVEGNHCAENSYYGIFNYGLNNQIVGNYVHGNRRHGIVAQGLESIYSQNLIYDNGQETAGTYHGIYVTNDADRCSFVGNHISSPGDTQEDGIHVSDGAVDLIINDNYCHDGMGDGICLVANNDNCVLDGNRCRDNDDIGINNVAATSDRCIITCNQLLGNTGANLVDAGTGTMVAHNITA